MHAHIYTNLVQAPCATHGATAGKAVATPRTGCSPVSPIRAPRLSESRGSTLRYFYIMSVYIPQNAWLIAMVSSPLTGLFLTFRFRQILPN